MWSFKGYDVLKNGRLFQLLQELKQGKGRLMSIIFSSKGIYDNLENNEVSGVMAMEVKKVKK